MAGIATAQKFEWTRYVRAQDFVWLLLFAALAILGPDRTPVAMFLLACLALFQVLESKYPFFSTDRGAIASIMIKLALGWLLIGFTHGVASSYYFILLLPVVAAATTLGLLGTTLFIIVAAGAYLSFLLYIDWSRQYIPEEQLKELMLRVALLPVVGFLTQQLAEANRIKARNYQAVAEQLATANQNLQDAEAAVRRADRLAALGQLTAGLAHELRNPIATIRSSAEMLTKSLPAENEVARELAGYIGSEVDRTNSLITRFLDFARPVHLRLAPADISACIDRAVLEIERHSPPVDVAIFKNYSPDVPPFPFDFELMERVLYNLILNAAQASPAKAAVTVKTRPVDGEVEIAVIDRGSGIDPKHLENIFNPFFTTKAAGVGLGLAIVSKVVDEHGGRTVVESNRGEGSIFRIYMPLTQRS